MKPEEAFELRRNRWEKLKEHFMPTTVQGVIDKELSENYDSCLRFPVDDEDWLIVCWVPIFYYSYGFEQKDEAEVPAYIEATSRLRLNGDPIGPRVTIKIIPPRTVEGTYQFPGLKKTVAEVISGRRIATSPSIFTVASIMDDPTAPPSTDETTALVERMVDALVEMGFTRRSAAKKASSAVAANPDIDSIDRLLEAVIEGE